MAPSPLEGEKGPYVWVQRKERVEITKIVTLPEVGQQEMLLTWHREGKNPYGLSQAEIEGIVGGLYNNSVEIPGCVPRRCLPVISEPVYQALRTIRIMYGTTTMYPFFMVFSEENRRENEYATVCYRDI